MSLDALSHEDRIRLIRFVCSFAWADLRVVDEERALVQELIRKLDLPEQEGKLVQQWLDHPPIADLLDPGEIPMEHRKMFLEAAEAMVVADGIIEDDEAENLALLRELLA